ncbi:hypothetical protein Tco_0946622 [Tanacetum coccineum]
MSPLSPFLFILIMKSLHLSFQKVVNEGLFKGVSIGSSLQLSHLFYADGVIFMGQWSGSNIATIGHGLKCLHRASGLRIICIKSRVLASKEKGGSGVSSYFALNQALMFKWVWHFRNDSNSLWVRVIKAMHGKDGRIGKSTKSSHPFIWVDIVNEMYKLKIQELDLLSLMKKNMGNREDTLF